MPDDTLPNPYTFGDDPLPDDLDQLVTEIKQAARARRNHALRHAADCNCDGCYIRRGGQRAPRRNVA